MGDALLWAGRLDEASAVIRSSLEVARSLSDQDCIARALISVSLLEDRLGNGQEAAARLDEAILLLHQLSIGLDGEKRIKNAHGLGVCYANKAQLARNEGRPDEAHRRDQGIGGPYNGDRRGNVMPTTPPFEAE